jgi:hypothetical protein
MPGAAIGLRAGEKHLETQSKCFFLQVVMMEVEEEV